MANPETLLPPGFRFHPTDEELILHYLRNRAASLPCPVSVVAEVDIYKFDPWDLPGELSPTLPPSLLPPSSPSSFFRSPLLFLTGAEMHGVVMAAKAMYGDREWYFFSPRDRKYPNGVRPNRAAGSGYWKATGTDKVITAAPGGMGIGVKKALVFYRGRPPKGSKTNWIMHEYRLAENPAAAHARPLKASRETSMRLDDWVLCRIYKKSGSIPGPSSTDRDEPEEYSNAEDLRFAPGTTSAGVAPRSTGGAKLPKTFSFCDLFDDGDYSVLARLLCDNPLDMAGPSCPELGPLMNLNQNSFMGSVGDESALGFSLPKLTAVESPASDTSSCLKRRRTETEEEGGAAKSKKPNSLCIDYTSFGNQINYGASPPHCNMLTSPFLDPQILLNSHLGLH
ncbi:hypothetical protein Taro_028931 [Colocasia esculenta]|uniref:NAC domain-containing protein n=1 Tax=Colocasia esculenta TaxID=4460 RepID=A0A843VVN0_COLES|nr:hypothetical protein [Colocasia esculenta]